MRPTLRTMALGGLLALGSILGFGIPAAKAQGYGGYSDGYVAGYGHGHHGGYGHGHHGGHGHGDNGHGAPPRRYYGHGGHDFRPHWHTTQTPFGAFVWYGNGAHDFQPHEHTRSAYGGYRGYSPSPFGGVTTSYYTSTPYLDMPW